MLQCLSIGMKPCRFMMASRCTRVQGRALQSQSQSKFQHQRLSARWTSSKPRSGSNSGGSGSGSGNNRTRDLVISGVSVCCVLGALYYFEQSKAKAAASRNADKAVGKASVGGPYSLYNQDGEPVTDATYHGQFVLLYFGFTFCPDICPNEINKLTEVLDAIGTKKNGAQSIIPVFITIDPARDTIGQLKYYSRDFDPRFTWLTGTIEQLQTVAKAFRVYIGKVDEEDAAASESEDGGEYLVDHSSFIYLMGPDGQCLDFYGKGQEVDYIAESVKLHVLSIKNKS